MKVSPGTRLGPYDIIAPIGAGGMGEVFRARDTKLNRDVAIKVLPAAVAQDAERRERFEREALALGALNHPGIVTVYAVESQDDTAFLAMELVEGRPLSDIIPRGGLPLGQMLRIGAAVADAVAAAHQKGITHRDLKPANIVIGAGEHEGRVKVLDFGLAKGTPTTPGGGISQLPTAVATGEGRILGTVAYMSPEQAEGKAIDVRSDLFSLGVILYEMATGARPFTGDTNISVLSAIVKDTPKSLTDVNPSLPRDLARIVRRALAKDPEKRYQTAKDLRNDLEELKASLDSGELAAESARGGVTPAGHTRIWRWTAITAVIVAVGALGALLLSQRRISSSTPGASAPRITMTPLTNTGNAELAQISPDGKYVAYVLKENGQYSGWVRQLSSGSTVRIIEPAPDLYGLTIAPDGSFVDFVRGRSPASFQPMDLFRVPFLGGPARKILEDVASAPGWSPDGSRMSYITQDPTEIRLMVAKADGTEPRVIASRKRPLRYANIPLVGRADTRPVWFPDGRSLAVMTQDDRRGLQLTRVDLETGAETELLTLEGATTSHGGLALGRDGESITINQRDQGSPQVVRVGLRSGEVTLLTNDLARYGGVSAAGDAIVTTRYQTTSSLWVTDASGRNARQIGRDASSGVSGLCWIGASQLLYTATMADGSGLWSLDTGTGASALLVPNAATPSMSADGRVLVFQKGREIWRSDPDGRNASRVVTGFSPSIAPDGSRVFYLSSQSGAQTVWVVDLAGGPPRQFTTLTANAGIAPALSPDGQRVAIDSEGDMVILPADGGEPIRRIPMRFRGLLRWTPDGRGLTYADVMSANAWVVQIDGGAPRQMTTFADDRQITSGAWSPDGKQFAIARSVTTSDIVLLKGVR